MSRHFPSYNVRACGTKFRELRAGEVPIYPSSGSMGEAPPCAVVATGSVSVNADYDNGTPLQPLPRYRRSDERATGRLDAGLRGTSRVLPGPTVSSRANLYAHCPHVVNGSRFS